MIKRFIHGLTSPNKIVEYKDDKFYHTLLVLLFMTLVYLIPVVYLSLTTEMVTYGDINALKYTFSRGEDCNYKIENNKLVYLGSGDNVSKYNINGIDIVFTLGEYKQKDITHQTIIFHEDAIYYVYGNYKFVSVKYSDIDGANNLDFRMAKDHSSVFWDDVSTILFEIGDSFKGLFVTINIITNVVVMLVDVLMMSLLIGIIYKMNIGGKFNSCFKIAVITASPYFLGIFFAVLFNNFFFNYVFLGWTVVISIMVTNKMRVKRGI